MKRRYRLRRKSDFQATLQGRRLFSGRGLVALAVPGRAGRSRVGVTVSRKLRTAVERNRARRRLRELARTTLVADSAEAARGIPYDVVLIARPAAVSMRFAELRHEAEEAARRLAAVGAQP